MQGEAAKADAAAARQRLGALKGRLDELRAQEREVSSEVSGILQDADAEEQQVHICRLSGYVLTVLASLR